MNRWHIAIKYRGEDLYSTEDLKVLPVPDGKYWADPFLATHEGKHYVFFEEYDYDKGRIAVAELHGLNAFEPRVIIDEPNHLSFPSVIQDGKSWYMTPERSLAGELLVYGALSFPDDWGVIASVAQGRYDDPILKKVKHGWEIWATDDNKLRVFFSESITGRWYLLRSEDKPYMRSAGHFFKDLFGEVRPTQDSVPTYGNAVVFLRGDNVIGRMEHAWYDGATGCHTFNFNDKYVVTDVRVPISHGKKIHSSISS